MTNNVIDFESHKNSTVYNTKFNENAIIANNVYYIAFGKKENRLEFVFDYEYKMPRLQFIGDYFDTIDVIFSSYGTMLSNIAHDYKSFVMCLSYFTKDNNNEEIKITFNREFNEKDVAFTITHSSSEPYLLDKSAEKLLNIIWYNYFRDELYKPIVSTNGCNQHQTYLQKFNKWLRDIFKNIHDC